MNTSNKKEPRGGIGGTIANMEQELDLPFYDIFAPTAGSKVAKALAGQSKMVLTGIPTTPYTNGAANKDFTFYPQNASGSYNAADSNAQMTRYMSSVAQNIYAQEAIYAKAMADAKGDKKKETLAKNQLDSRMRGLYKKDFATMKAQYQNRDRLYNQANAVADVISQITGMRRGLALAYLQQYTTDPYERTAKGIVGKYLAQHLPKGNKVINAVSLSPVEKALSIIPYDQASLAKISAQGYVALKDAQDKITRQDAFEDFVLPTMTAESRKGARTIAYEQPAARQKYTDSVIQRYSTGLGTPAVRPIKSGAMSAFPQWMFHQIQSSKARRNTGYMSVLAAKRMSQSNDPIMSAMAKLDPQLSTWDDAKKMWTGKWAQKQQLTALKKADRYNAMTQRNSQTLQTAYTVQQFKDKVPDFITQLVVANDDIAGVGMGPLKKGGVGLYAGRWLDPVTGRMRILPTASQKYINPFIAGQKKAFLEARILNKWNQLQMYYQQYVNFKTEKYQESQMNKLKNGLNPVQNEITANRKISKAIESFISGFPNPQNMRWLLLDSVGSERLSEIYTMRYPESDVKKIRNAKMMDGQAKQGKDRIQAWQTSIRAGAVTLQQKINKSSQNELSKTKLLLRMQQTLIGLLSVGGQGKSAIKMLIKGLTIPANASVADSLKAKQTYDIFQQRLKQNSLSIGQLRSPGDYIASEQFWKKSLQPSLSKVQRNQQIPIQAVTSFMNTITKSTGLDNRLQSLEQLRQFTRSKPYKQSLQNVAGQSTRNKVLPYLNTFKSQTGNSYYSR